MEVEQKALIIYAPHRGFERCDNMQTEPQERFVQRKEADKRKSPRTDFDPFYELNQFLNSGWRVVIISPMGGGYFHPEDKRLAGSVLSFASLVILEREES